MVLLKQKEKEQISQAFRELSRPVRLIMFTQEHECEYCEVTRNIVEEVAALSDKLELTVHDFVSDKGLAEEYQVDKIPAVIVAGERDYGIRFYGVPSGYEFATLIEDILDLGRGGPDLPPDVLEQLRQVDQPVRMQVMISPT